MANPRPFQISVSHFLMACAVPPPPTDPVLVAKYAIAARKADEILDDAIQYELERFLEVSYWLFGLDRLAGLVHDHDLKPTAALAQGAGNRKATEAVVVIQIRRDVNAHLWKPGQPHRLRTALTVVATYRALFNRADEQAANRGVQGYLATVVSTMFASRMHGVRQPAMWRRALHQFTRFLSTTRN